jgi:hypothetical protein
MSLFAKPAYSEKKQDRISYARLSASATATVGPTRFAFAAVRTIARTNFPKH